MNFNKALCAKFQSDAPKTKDGRCILGTFSYEIDTLEVFSISKRSWVKFYSETAEIGGQDFQINVINRGYTFAYGYLNIDDKNLYRVKISNLRYSHDTAYGKPI